jgi:toluene monooxygenase system ferredoxin subunit
MPMKYFPALNETELVNGETVGLKINCHSILLIKHNNNLYAYKNQCAHLKYPLTDAGLLDSELVCSLHHWRYDVTTGRGLNPTNVSLSSYPIKVLEGHIYVGLDE